MNIKERALELYSTTKSERAIILALSEEVANDIIESAGASLDDCPDLTYARLLDDIQSVLNSIIDFSELDNILEYRAEQIREENVDKLEAVNNKKGE